MLFSQLMFCFNDIYYHHFHLDHVTVDCHLLMNSVFIIYPQMVRLDEGVYIHYMEAQDALNSRHDGAKMVRILMKYLFSKEMLRDGNICYSGDRGKGQPLDPLIVEALFSKFYLVNL